MNLTFFSLSLDDGLNSVNQDIAKIFFQLSHHANATIGIIQISRNQRDG